MKQITQKELIDLIKEKQENAQRELFSIQVNKNLGEALLTKERNKAYIDAYQDLICYINSVKIVPEATLITMSKEEQEELGKHQQEYINKMLEKSFITPYIEPKVEPLRNDRFREFEQIIEKGRTRKEIVDAKSISFIRFYNHCGERLVIEIWSNCGYVDEETFTDETNAIAYYNDLVEWWKYWKQN